MPYITIPIKPKDRQLSFEDILYGVKTLFDQNERHTNNTRTVFREHIPAELIKQHNVHHMLYELKRFNERHEALIAVKNKGSLYRSFSIPKRSGGLRPIDAPNEELASALRDLKAIFENKLFASYHTAAFAYIKGRCTKDALERHQKNDSRWFLKLDFSNFFGSSTPTFIMDMLGQLFPFCEIIKLEGGRDALNRALSLCFLKGGLPQGTPMSPTLTNLMMIPIDHYIAKVMKEHSSRICYTRYADDLLLSSNLDFRWSEVQQTITEILKKFNAPFSIKKEKTHYGSRAGRNWNLGLMLNKDNQITVGHKKKKALKAIIFSILTDYRKGILWSAGDAQTLRGLISYYAMIEKQNIEKIIADYNQKLNLNVYDVIKSALLQIEHPQNQSA